MFKELLVLSKWICLIGLNILSGSIFIKLFRLRKRSDIINTMFLIHIFVTSVLVHLRVFSFFQLGYSHFVRDQADYEEDIQACTFYIVTSATNIMFSGCINTVQQVCWVSSWSTPRLTPSSTMSLTTASTMGSTILDPHTLA